MTNRKGIPHIGPLDGEQIGFGRLTNKLGQMPATRGCIVFANIVVGDIWHLVPKISNETRKSGVNDLRGLLRGGEEWQEGADCLSTRISVRAV